MLIWLYGSESVSTDNTFNEDDNSAESEYTTQMSFRLLKESVAGNTICKILYLQIFNQLFLLFEDVFELAKGRFHFFQ